MPGNPWLQLGKALAGAGKDFGSYALSAARRGGTNSVLRGLAWAGGGAIAGGTINSLQGGSFRKGALIGATAGLGYKTFASARNSGALGFMGGNLARGTSRPLNRIGSAMFGSTRKAAMVKGIAGYGMSKFYAGGGITGVTGLGKGAIFGAGAIGSVASYRRSRGQGRGVGRSLLAGAVGGTAPGWGMAAL